ncbi:MAG: helix-turn-helix transcriptional regulator [Ruminococcaceae bacterium]|jgi:DNA-binding Xre family transcriptional regulator|nr:helix-turn-helix transcriptional regulator [Oscillospiraceae bacterium]
MAMNYNRLWKMLIDRNMMKKDLIQKAGISTNAMAKMGKGGDVSTQVLRKICTVLDCGIEDIVEVVADSADKCEFLDVQEQR